MRRAMLILATLAGGTVLAGCAATPPPAARSGDAPGATAEPPVAPGEPPAIVERVVPVAPSIAPPEAPAATPTPEFQDAKRASQQFFEITFVDLALPQGSISTNPAFWKPLDETFLGLWRHDVLNKNGMRVGRASISEIPSLQKELAGADTHTQKLIGTESKETEIPVRTNVPRQTIFFADRNGEFEGRDYEASDDVFAVRFHRAPRHEDRVRIAISPKIRDRKQKFEVADADSLQVRLVKGETLYDLGVQVELAVNECLVIAPSPAALENPSLVGRTFLMEDRSAERIEHVLVIMPSVQGTLIETTPGVAQR